MTRPNPYVRWTGRATSPELAIPCPTCNAERNRACLATVFPLPHAERAVRAADAGFVAVERAAAELRA